MADGISFRVFTKPFDDLIADRSKRMDRAAMFAVRDAGRVAKRVGRANAPVLKDKTLQSHRQLQKRIRGGDLSAKAAYGTRDENGVYKASTPIPGLLKASISSRKNLQRLGTGIYVNKVGPRGLRVHVYAGKVAVKAMQKAEEAAKAELARIARAAFERVWR